MNPDLTYLTFPALMIPVVSIRDYTPLRRHFEMSGKHILIVMAGKRVREWREVLLPFSEKRPRILLNIL